MCFSRKPKRDRFDSWDRSLWLRLCSELRREEVMVKLEKGMCTMLPMSAAAESESKRSVSRSANKFASRLPNLVTALAVSHPLPPLHSGVCKVITLLCDEFPDRISSWAGGECNGATPPSPSYPESSAINTPGTSISTNYSGCFPFRDQLQSPLWLRRSR